MTRRLFIAVPLPDSARDTLEAVIGPRRDLATDVRWLPAANLHLTLAFLGEVDDDRADVLGGHLEEVAGRAAPFTLTVAGGGCFPHADAAKVLWLGVRAGADELTALAQRCRSAASRSGIAVEGGRYRPHLTVARASRPVAVRGWLGVLDSIDPVTWQADRLTLFSSRLAPGGASYTAVAGFGLGAASRADED